MAQRPVFIPTSSPPFVRERLIEFAWHKGMAPSQKRKNVVELHKAAADEGLDRLLEISTKSESHLGIALSAFNLQVGVGGLGLIPLECAFQGSKVFEDGGPFEDLLTANARDAKRDSRLKESGRLIGFRLGRMEFPTLTKTAFYDWLYMRAIARVDPFESEINDFDGFTDIEFNPKKSLNCQARSCALGVSLLRQGLLAECQESPRRFLEVISPEGTAAATLDERGLFE